MALNAERKTIEEAPVDLMTSQARKDLLAQNSTQKKLNWWGRIFANGALSVGHETQLREAVEDIQKNDQHVLTLCLLSKTKGLTAFVALQAQQSEEALGSDQFVARILDFETMSPAKRMKTVLALQGLGDEWQRRTVQQLVVGNASKNNLRGSRYGGYLTAKDEGVHEEVSETTRYFLPRGIWTKKKTTYAFNADAFIRALEQSELGLSGEVENIVYAAVEKTIRKESAYQARSRLFGANHLLSQICAADGIRTKLEQQEMKHEEAMGRQPEPEHHGMIVRVPTEVATQ